MVSVATDVPAITDRLIAHLNGPCGQAAMERILRELNEFNLHTARHAFECALSNAAPNTQAARILQSLIAITDILKDQNG